MWDISQIYHVHTTIAICPHIRFAVSWRNNWMLKQSDYVVTYITYSWGGAAQFAEKAARQKKTVINIAAYP